MSICLLILLSQSTEGLAAQTTVVGDVINEYIYSGIVPDITATNAAHAALLDNDGAYYSTWSGSGIKTLSVNFIMYFDEIQVYDFIRVVF